VTRTTAELAFYIDTSALVKLVVAAPPGAASHRVVGFEGEPYWVRWRLGLVVSNPGGVRSLGSVEGCFGLRSWEGLKHLRVSRWESASTSTTGPPSVSTAICRA